MLKSYLTYLWNKKVAIHFHRVVLESYKGTFLPVNFGFSLAKKFIFQSFGLESLSWVPDEVSTREDFLNFF